tara:strand:+ start:448 stop:705 length:258 start_codon:yes stop_codon:yes gene_type:complete
MNILTNKKDIKAFQVVTLLKGLKLEIETGMKIRNGISTMNFIKKHFGIMGRRKKSVYNRFLYYAYEMEYVDQDYLRKEYLPIGDR